MKKKKKKKLRKSIKLLLSIILVITVGYTSITIYKNNENRFYNFFIPKKNNKKDKITIKTGGFSPVFVV